MVSGRHVLVVDGQVETEEVLKAVLEPRGLAVNRIRQRNAVSQKMPAPAVVVVDAESVSADSDRAAWPGVPRVIIGEATVSDRRDGDDAEHYIQKPFQYRDLVLAIEQLLDKAA